MPLDQHGHILGHCNVDNRIEADHVQLKRRLRPMRHLRNDRTAALIIRGHAFRLQRHDDRRRRRPNVR